MNQRRFVDLHTHSTASDGASSPEELIGLADEKKLAAIALTDHDTVEGLAKAAAAAKHYPDLQFVPGIEVSARFTGGTLHILGLGIDPQSQAIQSLCAQMQLSRRMRNPQIIARLQGLGMNITMEDALAETAGDEPARPGRGEGRILGRLHIAAAMVRKGCVKSIDEAFARYIGNERPAYVDKERLAPSEAVAAIHAGGGKAFLAHPPQLNCQNLSQFERVLRELIHQGLSGIECYHSDNTAFQTRHYLELARRYHLAISGGSDFHGPHKPTVQLGRPLVPLSVVEEWLSI